MSLGSGSAVTNEALSAGREVKNIEEIIPCQYELVGDKIVFNKAQNLNRLCTLTINYFTRFPAYEKNYPRNKGLKSNI